MVAGLRELDLARLAGALKLCIHILLKPGEHLVDLRRVRDAEHQVVVAVDLREVVLNGRIVEPLANDRLQALVVGELLELGHVEARELAHLLVLLRGGVFQVPAKVLDRAFEPLGRGAERLLAHVLAHPEEPVEELLSRLVSEIACHFLPPSSISRSIAHRLRVRLCLGALRRALLPGCAAPGSGSRALLFAPRTP